MDTLLACPFYFLNASLPLIFYIKRREVKGSPIPCALEKINFQLLAKNIY